MKKPRYTHGYIDRHASWKEVVRYTAARGPEAIGGVGNGEGEKQNNDW